MLANPFEHSELQEISIYGSQIRSLTAFFINPDLMYEVELDNGRGGLKTSKHSRASRRNRSRL